MSLLYEKTALFFNLIIELDTNIISQTNAVWVPAIQVASPINAIAAKARNR